MKENLGHLLFLATVLVIASLLPRVAPYPMQQHQEPDMAQSNTDTEVKEPPTYILPQSNMDARYVTNPSSIIIFDSELLTLRLAKAVNILFRHSTFSSVIPTGVTFG